MKVILLALTMALSAQAQAQAPSTPGSAEALVYVYMPHHAWTTWRFSGKFYVDERRTAEISKNRYFVLRLPAGKHSFYVRDKKFGGLDLDLMAGETYYLKVMLDEGGNRIKFRGVTTVPKEEAQFIIREIQPIKRGDVYDKLTVDPSVVSP